MQAKILLYFEIYGKNLNNCIRNFEIPGKNLTFHKIYGKSLKFSVSL